jgi:putative membrane protein
MGIELFMNQNCMTMKTSLSFLTAALAAFLCLPVAADDKRPAVSTGDEKFIKNTAESGMTEVRLSELATQKASRPDVKEFAKMLVTDHSMLNEGLKALASSKAVQLSAIIAPTGAAKFKDLETFQTGKAFDNEFLSYTASSHRRMVREFEEAAKDVADADLKAWINKSLPTLRTHLDKALAMQPPAPAIPTTIPPI